MRRVTLTLLFHLLILETFSQKTNILPQRRIDDILIEIINCKDDVYVLNNVEIIYENSCYRTLDSIYATNPTVKTDLSIGTYLETNIKVTNKIKQWEGYPASLWFYNIIFEKNISCYPGSAYQTMYWRNCTFKEGFYIDAKSPTFHMDIVGCEIKNSFSIDVSKTQKAFININYCNIHQPEGSISPISNINGGNNTDLAIQNSHFTSYNSDSSYISINKNFYSILMDSCLFEEDIAFNQLNVVNNFSIKHTSFRNVSMEDFVPPPSGGIAVEWKQLASHLCIISSGSRAIPDSTYGTVYVQCKNPIFKGNETEDLADFARFEKLTASYYNFLNIYKERGDAESANACYIEVKDIQTRRLGYLYKTNPTINNYFLWKTNLFLRYFCDYGTNPAKSVIISFYVILIFGGFYFFFYSNWDRINKAYFLHRYSALSKYLSSKTTLHEFYQLSNTREINTYKEFKEELNLRKNEVPSYYTFLGHLLYRYSTSRYKIISLIVKKLDIQKGLWKDQKTSQKIMIGLFIGTTICFFTIYTILIKSLSATILSLNAFSTLGFGNIPVKGLSKYLTVLEGFLGWLLLSIFSVSLIAQMIQ